MGRGGGNMLMGALKTEKLYNFYGNTSITLTALMGGG